MNFSGTDADAIVRALRGDFAEAPMSNNARAIVTAIRGLPEVSEGISTETLEVSRAFRGQVVPSLGLSTNAVAIIRALGGMNTLGWPISNTTRTIITQILHL